MSSIITITFSPCIDKSTFVSSLVPEKKLKCAAPKLEPGGGGINVARVIHKSGGDVTAVFPLGGCMGKVFNQLLEKENVPSIIINSKNETRENIIVLDESTNSQYRLGMPGTALSETEWGQCLEVIKKTECIEFIVASGSLPPGVPQHIYALLAKIAIDKNVKFVADTSGEALKHAAEKGAYLIKPNLGELASLAGLQIIEIKDAEAVAKKILQRYPIEILVVSLGSAGAILVTKNETYKVAAPEIRRKSTVGAGDSMVAGIVFSLSKSENLNRALQYGVACGTAATMNSGTELCRPNDVQMLYEQILAAEK